MILKTSYKMKPPVSAKPTKSVLKRLGLVCLLVMNENSGTKVFDSSGNGNTGTFVNHTAWSLGKYGYALIFDSTDDYIEVVDKSSLFPNAWTIVTSIKPRNQTWQAVVGWQDAWNFPAVYANVNGKPLIYLGGDNYRYFAPAAWNTLKDGNEHIVAFTCPGNSQTAVTNSQMFVDGIEQAADSTKSGAGQAAKSTIHLFFSNDKYYGGRSSFFALYNRVLPDTEIQLYQRPFYLFERRARPELCIAPAVVKPHNSGTGFRPIYGADRLRGIRRNVLY